MIFLNIPEKIQGVLSPSGREHHFIDSLNRALMSAVFAYPDDSGNLDKYEVFSIIKRE